MIKRCSCLIDQNGVDLIDDTVVQISLYQLFFIDNHVITQIIKSKFVVRYISNIASYASRRSSWFISFRTTPTVSPRNS